MFRIGIPITVVLALIYFVSSLIKPSVNRNDIRTAIVQRGSIEGSISASGTIVPIFEQVTSSPVETRLLSVRKRPGETVNKGESILELDPSELRLAMERTEKQLKLEENRKEQLRLDIERSLNNLDGQLHIKELRLKYLKSKTAQGEKMMDIGAIVPPGSPPYSPCTVLVSVSSNPETSTKGGFSGSWIAISLAEPSVPVAMKAGDHADVARGVRARAGRIFLILAATKNEGEDRQDQEQGRKPHG